LIYEAGKSAPKDPKKAATLYKKACDGGDDVGCEGVKRLGG
jgi:TPR repeat protein